MAAHTSQLYAGPGMIADYHDWFEAAYHGDVLVYHVGDLQFDRQLVFDETDPAQKDDWIKTTVLDAVATAIVVDAGRNLLTLTQRRLGESHYEYRATRLRFTDERRRQAGEQSDAERLLD